MGAMLLLLPEPSEDLVLSLAVRVPWPEVSLDQGCCGASVFGRGIPKAE